MYGPCRVVPFGEIFEYTLQGWSYVEQVMLEIPEIDWDNAQSKNVTTYRLVPHALVCLVTEECDAWTALHKIHMEESATWARDKDALTRTNKDLEKYVKDVTTRLDAVKAELEQWKARVTTEAKRDTERLNAASQQLEALLKDRDEARNNLGVVWNALGDIEMLRLLGPLVTNPRPRSHEERRTVYEHAMTHNPREIP